MTSFEKPVKHGDEYIAFARGNVLFQLPRGSIDLESGIIAVSGKKAQAAMDKIAEYETAALSECKANSADWFGTTHFTEEYIDSKFNSSATAQSGQIQFTYQTDQLRVFDHFKDLIKTPQKTVLKGNSILEFVGLVFKGTSIRSRFELKQIKLTFEPTKVTKFCLEDNEIEPEQPKPEQEQIATVDEIVPESFESVLDKM